MALIAMEGYNPSAIQVEYTPVDQDDLQAQLIDLASQLTPEDFEIRKAYYTKKFGRNYGNSINGIWEVVQSAMVARHEGVNTDFQRIVRTNLETAVSEDPNAAATRVYIGEMQPRWTSDGDLCYLSEHIDKDTKRLVTRNASLFGIMDYALRNESGQAAPFEIAMFQQERNFLDTMWTVRSSGDDQVCTIISPKPRSADPVDQQLCVERNMVQDTIRMSEMDEDGNEIMVQFWIPTTELSRYEAILAPDREGEPWDQLDIMAAAGPLGEDKNTQLINLWLTSNNLPEDLTFAISQATTVKEKLRIITGWTKEVRGYITSQTRDMLNSRSIYTKLMQGGINAINNDENGLKDMLKLAAKDIYDTQGAVAMAIYREFGVNVLEKQGVDMEKLTSEFIYYLQDNDPNDALHNLLADNGVRATGCGMEIKQKAIPNLNTLLNYALSLSSSGFMAALTSWLMNEDSKGEGVFNCDKCGETLQRNVGELMKVCPGCNKALQKC
jgi:hypothetical protein